MMCADSSPNTIERRRKRKKCVRCQVSGVRSQVSGVRCQLSGVRCQVSGVRCQVLYVTCLMSLTPLTPITGSMFLLHQFLAQRTLKGPRLPASRVLVPLGASQSHLRPWLWILEAVFNRPGVAGAVLRTAS